MFIMENVKGSVSQVSVLGPLLFLIYINDITMNLTCNTSLFADDTSLYKLIDGDTSILEVQNDLDKIGDWANKWKVKFNPLKSESLLNSLNNQTNNRHNLYFKIITLIMLKNKNI